MFDNQSAFGTEIPFGSTTEPMNPTIDTIGSDSAYAAIEPQIQEPVMEPKPEVSAYIKEVIPCGYHPEEEHIEFDVIINANVGSDSATLIKRIKFCKHNLCHEVLAQKGKQATMVEEIQVTQVDKVDQNVVDATSKRLRELCGIPNSKNWV